MRLTTFSGNGGFSPPPVKEWLAIYFVVNTPCIRSLFILITFNRLALMTADWTYSSQHQGWLKVSADELTNLEQEIYNLLHAGQCTPVSVYCKNN